MSPGRQSQLSRFEHSDPTIGEISEPHPPLGVLREESDHLRPRREWKLSEFSGDRIESGKVGAEIVSQPQASSFFVNHHSINTHVGSRPLVERYLAGLLIDPAQPMALAVPEPNIVLGIDHHS